MGWLGRASAGLDLDQYLALDEHVPAEEAVPILRVADAARAVAWYDRLGFAKTWEHRFEPDLPAFVEVARGGVRLFLSEHTGDARPGTLLHLAVRDVDEIAVDFDLPVEDLPWGRQIELTDPDTNRLRLCTQPPPNPARTPGT
ncbi:glyoxalase superfamily protein [Streptomyces sp. BI20]|uniref:glyoxalase superfamily protein n=1 Tax=Streptomyces sp. BI20 TaxID=3403460 RepID=UPI003C73B34A